MRGWRYYLLGQRILHVLFEEIGLFHETFPKAEDRVEVDLSVGDFSFKSIDTSLLACFDNVRYYDTELLGRLFCQREVFVMPYAEVVRLPDRLPHAWLGALVHFIKQYVGWLQEQDESYYYVLAAVLHDFEAKAEQGQLALQGKKSFTHPILDFRVQVYPHVYFFLHHPSVSKGVRAEVERAFHSMAYDMLLTKRVSLRDLRPPHWFLRMKEGKKSDTSTKD